MIEGPVVVLRRTLYKTLTFIVPTTVEKTVEELCHEEQFYAMRHGTVIRHLLSQDNTPRMELTPFMGYGWDTLSCGLHDNCYRFPDGAIRRALADWYESQDIDKIFDSLRMEEGVGIYHSPALDALQKRVEGIWEQPVPCIINPASPQLA